MIFLFMHEKRVAVTHRHCHGSGYFKAGADSTFCLLGLSTIVTFFSIN
jgi:hypothetical protein